MINLDDHDLFRDNKNTLKELSKDDPRDGVTVPKYMTESALNAVDFDMVKRRYTNAHGHSENHANSVDAISHTDDEVVFIEFKNGNVVNREIRDKIRDSLLMFCDITETTVSYTRQYVDFMLVYNEDNHPLPNQMTKGLVQNSPARLSIAQKLAKLGKQDFIRFELGRFKGLYFKNVHTYTQEQFEAFIPTLKE